ncbi:hypothetical protein B296_00046732 [Ensete ventricosum]|uniref:Uncharacterized protein n=1 Tax=Ensete ventricosum TaxID=4639 RepID=A0A426X9D5_ENSVE|nr:hypothetical protein B296_00046732 [Ensete ventricosum]
MQNRICGKRQQKQDNRETNRRGWREVTLESDGKSTEGRALWRQPRGQREAAEEVERLEVLVLGFRTTGSETAAAGLSARGTHMKKNIWLTLTQGLGIVVGGVFGGEQSRRGRQSQERKDWGFGVRCCWLLSP